MTDTIKVRVVKATGSRYWYSNQIGEIFTVDAKPFMYGIRKNRHLAYAVALNRTKVLHADDIEILFEKEKVVFV